MERAVSNNGTVHYAMDHTVGWAAKLVSKVLNWSSYKRMPSRPGYVRKMCDGQWVKSRGLPSSLVVTCEPCIRNEISHDAMLNRQYTRLR